MTVGGCKRSVGGCKRQLPVDNSGEVGRSFWVIIGIIGGLTDKKKHSKLKTNNKRIRQHPKANTIKRKRWFIRLNRVLFSRHSSFWIIITGFLMIVISIIIFSWNESFDFNKILNADKIAQLADFIGGIVGSVWALAGVILFYVALTLQRKEFQLQRQELRETRNIFEQQADQYKLQQRETTFFNLLNHHNQVVLNISKRESSSNRDNNETIILTGYQALSVIWKKIKSDWEYFKQYVNQKIEISRYDLNSGHPDDQFAKYDSLRQIYSSVHHIINFIAQYLDNEIFYYKILLNNISVEEREIITTLNEYCLYNDIEKLDFAKYPVDFSIDLNETSWFIPLSDFLPRLQIKIENRTYMGIDMNHFGVIEFEEDMYLANIGISIENEEDYVIEECDLFVSRSDKKTFKIDDDFLKKIKEKTIANIAVNNPRNENKLYFIIRFNQKEYRIINNVHYIKNHAGEFFNF